MLPDRFATMLQKVFSPDASNRALSRTGHRASRRAAWAAVESLERRALLSATLAAGPTLNFGSGFVAGSFDVADFNADGVGDLVISDISNNSGSEQDHLVQGSADGNPVLAGVVNFPNSLLMKAPVLFVDVNHDGKPDVVQAMEKSDHSAGQVIVSLNNGDGSFFIPATPPTGTSNIVALLAADFNGDTAVDILDSAVPNSGFINDILLNNGDATFHENASFTADHPYESLAGGDFDADGHTDIATPFGIQSGKGDGTFNTILPYPAGNGLNRIIVGDFNNDSVPDLALVGGPDQTSDAAIITVLINDGHGNFTASTVPIGSGQTDVVGLTSVDMDGDGGVDLVATLGPTAGSEANTVAIMDGHGDGTFSPARFFALPTGTVAGPVIAAAFLNTARADVAVLDQTNNQVVFMKNTSIAPATVTLTSNFNNSIQGEAIQFTSTVQGSTATTPTGTVTFLDGTTTLGTSPLVGTTATFSTSSLTAGDHTITARYSGNSIYQSATSSSITQTVQPVSSAAHAISAQVTRLSVPSPAVPGDKGSINLKVGNFGSKTAVGEVSISLFASTNGALDTNAVLIAAPSLAHLHINLGSAKTENLSARFTLPNSLKAGTYQILAAVNAGKGFSGADISTGFGSSPQFSVVTQFGKVGSRRNVKLQQVASDKGVVTFSLSGPGTGTLSSGGAIVTIDGSTSSSHLSITKKGGDGIASIPQLTVNGSIGALGSKRDTLTVALTVNGNLPSLTLGDVNGARITITGKRTTKITLGAVTSTTIISSAPISALKVDSWRGTTPGKISAPTLGTINSAGAFNPVVALHAVGATLRSAKIGGSNGGLWGIAGNVGTVICKGTWTNGGVLAGTDFGADNTKGGTDDTFHAARFDFIEVTGAVSQCFFTAGHNPVDGTYLNGNDVLIPGSVIGKAIFLGTLGPESKVLAAHIPRQVQVAKIVVNTATDARFRL